ncbi:hypothetical protein fHeYen901_140 [Yersinia phage fHe-Yen9-01]|uniref:Uncharacterized protein n=1 Tax=Yersinia phage fHe-Yen9-01 TaxID=1965363 RepID=A0A1V0DXN2_9CAUD|nr:hypothetical protein KNT60_gp139 [Yersinia phage fHe-Yen9-01]ARB05913.1 hypothetical protein fHeYen901_140 [Yersinia phage fHe-Yen9-01]
MMKISKVQKTIKCKQCKEKLSTKEFKKSANSDNGLFPICRNCVNELLTNQINKCVHYWS